MSHVVCWSFNCAGFIKIGSIPISIQVTISVQVMSADNFLMSFSNIGAYLVEMLVALCCSTCLHFAKGCVALWTN